jgi:hypothetical protein
MIFGIKHASPSVRGAQVPLCVGQNRNCGMKLGGNLPTTRFDTRRLIAKSHQAPQRLSLPKQPFSGSSLVGFILIGCIKDEGHQSGNHKHEHVSEISILAAPFREVFKGVHCRVLGVAVNTVSLQY